MSKLLTTRYSASAFNAALLLLRLVFGILLMYHGYGKLTHFNEMKSTFMDFMGIGSVASLSLAVFAEFFCALFIVIGVFTRLAAIPVIILMCVVVLKVTHSDIFGNGETAMLYLAAYLTILILGPGKISVDGMVGK